MSTTRPEREIPLVPTNIFDLRELSRRLATTLNILLRSPIYVRPISSSDADAPNGTIYFSTDSSKLAFRDNSGISHDLY
jgi:hypothetical protein